MKTLINLFCLFFFLTQLCLAASSTVELSSSSYEQISTDKDWEAENTARTRCSIVNQDSVVNLDSNTMVGDTIQSCLNPFTLDGAILRVPNNTTRLDKDGLALCQLVQEDYVPTIVVYVMDHSGSMKTSDDGKIADDAFRNAIDQQSAIDPLSYAAYLPFESNVIQADSIHPLQLNSSANITKIKDAMNDTYDGGTDFYEPLVEAQNFLAQSRFDGYNKAIIMLADGDDTEQASKTDSLVAVNGFPKMYGIFLGDDANDAQRMEDVSNATGAYSTQISDADGVAPLITQLINDLVVVANPSEITLTNKANGVTRTADFSDMVQQIDGSWVLSFDQDIPLLENANEMTMQTIYKIGSSEISSDPIDFTIRVTADIVNEGVDIEMTPFETQCIEFTDINVYEDDTLLVTELVRRQDSLLVELTALEEDELGDTIQVELKSKRSKDVVTIELYKVFDNDTTNVYQSYVYNEWSDELDSIGAEDKLTIQPYDSILVKRINPNDPRDFQKTMFTVRITPEFYFEGDTLYADSIPLVLEFYDNKLDSIEVTLSFLDTVLDPYYLFKKQGVPYFYVKDVGLATAFLMTDIPSGEFPLIAAFEDTKTGLTIYDTVLVIKPQYALDTDPGEIVLFDKDTNGRLDSIKITYDDTINSSIKKSYQYTITWPNRSDSVVEHSFTAEQLSAYTLLSADQQIEYLLNHLGFSPAQTGLSDEWGQVVLTQIYEDDFGVFEREWDDLPVIDSMAPILVSSEIFWVEDGYDQDQLVIRFSEQMDTTITNVEELFNFLFEDFDEVVYYADDYEWRRDGQEFVIFFSGDDLNHTTRFNPRDGVKALIGEGYLKDKNGLSIANSEEWTNIDGDFNERIEVVEVVSSFNNLDEEFINRPDIEVEVFSVTENAAEIMKQRLEQGMVIGPIKVNENDPRRPEDIRWRYQFLIFSHLGQYVTRKHGVIECTSEMFKSETSSNCKDSRGIKVALKWNYKDKNGRFVGTGAYIIGLQVENRDLVTTTIAVKRSSENLDLNVDSGEAN